MTLDANRPKCNIHNCEMVEVCGWFHCSECDAECDAANRPLPDNKVDLDTAIGNVLDRWEQLPNDIRNDPGFQELDHALGALHRAQINQDKEWARKQPHNAQ